MLGSVIDAEVKLYLEPVTCPQSTHIGIFVAVSQDAMLPQSLLSPVDLDVRVLGG